MLASLEYYTVGAKFMSFEQIIEHSIYDSKRIALKNIIGGKKHNRLIPKDQIYCM